MPLDYSYSKTFGYYKILQVIPLPTNHIVEVAFYNEKEKSLHKKPILFAVLFESFDSHKEARREDKKNLMENGIDFYTDIAFYDIADEECCGQFYQDYGNFLGFIYDGDDKEIKKIMEEKTPKDELYLEVKNLLDKTENLFDFLINEHLIYLSDLLDSVNLERQEAKNILHNFLEKKLITRYLHSYKKTTLFIRILQRIQDEKDITR